MPTTDSTVTPLHPQPLSESSRYRLTAAGVRALEGVAVGAGEGPAPDDALVVYLTEHPSGVHVWSEVAG